MKRVTKLLSIAAMVTIVPSAVLLSTTPEVEAQSYRFYCEARSPSAYGYWMSNDLYHTKMMALEQCAIRTPYTQTCHIIHTNRCPY